jgi:hypothetical protein
MAAEFVVSMFMEHAGTPRDQEALRQLAEALPDATVGPADDVGIFDVTLSADDFEHALTRVWDAVAASGTDDHIVFLEHPDIPEHWKSRTRSAPR